MVNLHDQFKKYETGMVNLHDQLKKNMWGPVGLPSKADHWRKKVEQGKLTGLISKVESASTKIKNGLSYWLKKI